MSSTLEESSASIDFMLETTWSETLGGNHINEARSYHVWLLESEAGVLLLKNGTASVVAFFEEESHAVEVIGDVQFTRTGFFVPRLERRTASEIALMAEDQRAWGLALFGKDKQVKWCRKVER